MFCPEHKAAMVLFLDRVYGIQDQSFLLHLIEVGFLPDLQAAVSLDTVRRTHLNEMLFSHAPWSTFNTEYYFIYIWKELGG